MSWLQSAYDVVASLGGAAILTSGACFLGKKVIDNVFTRDTERYKDELKRESDSSLEKLRSANTIDLESHKSRLNAELETYKENVKHELQLVKDKHSVMFSKLHAERAEVIKTLIEKMYKLHYSIKNISYGIRIIDEMSFKEQMCNFESKYDETTEFFKLNKLFFTKELCNKISSYLNGLFDVYEEFEFCVSEKEDIKRSGDANNYTALQQAIATKRREFDSDIAPLFEGLEDEFRRLFGVDE
jgi:hypothetical protein